jgi:Zn-dependent protease
MSARSHFSIAGIPVRVEPFFVVIAVLFGLDLRELWLIIAWVVIVFVSVLVHELGHGVAFRIFGQRSSIVLHGFGGVTIPSGKPTAWTKRRSIIVSLAGSLTALLLIGLPAYALQESNWGQIKRAEWFIRTDNGPQVWPILHLVVFAAIYWSLANLLPIRPLDGGHVAEELFGLHNARWISIFAAGLGALYAFTNDNSYAGFFALMLGFFNYSEIRAERAGSAVTSAFDVDAPDAPPGSHRSAAKRGRGSLRSVPPMAPARPPGLRLEVEQAEPQVWNALRDGDNDGAARIIARVADTSRVNPYLTASLTLAEGRADRAVDQFEAAYVADPAGPPNLVATDLLAKSGRSAAVARQLLKRSDGAGRDGAATLQTHLHYAEHYRDAAMVGEAVFAAKPPSPPQTAFEVACSWSRAADVERAVEWLERAAALGFRAPTLADGEPDLAAVRADPRWPVIRAQLA